MNKLIVALCLVGTWGTLIAQGASCEEAEHPWDGSRTTPVHLVPLFDETGIRILPSFQDTMPFSVKNTCGPCHNYETVSSGFHFNSSHEGAPAGRPGEPWVWVDPDTGTQIPLSYRGWEGTWNPEDLGITHWEFTQQFARHMPGGDMGEPEDVYADPEARWTISGPLEVNCLGCHNGSPLEDMSEWAKQNSRENFRWAATAASGLASVSGMAVRMPNTWNIFKGMNPDDQRYAVPPAVSYAPDAFNAKNLIQFDIKYRVDDAKCLHCHSASEVHTEKWEQDMDIHSTLGMHCVDCHRNGLDHDIIRGYEGEALEKSNPAVGDFSCEGCHLGNEDGLTLASTEGGRLGAPKPEHEGLPAIHFEKLTCTACHSGTMPEDVPSLMRVSRVNRLGIHGVAQWFTDRPYIKEPVYVPNAQGKLEPHRMMWPAFWARMDGDTPTPLLPEQVQEQAVGILDAEQQVGSLTTSMTKIFTSAKVEESELGVVVFLTPGKDFRVDVDGYLDIKEYDVNAAEPQAQFEPPAEEAPLELTPEDIEAEITVEEQKPITVTYPKFDGEFLWAIERDFPKFTPSGQPVTDKDGNPIIEATKILPLVPDFDPDEYQVADMDYFDLESLIHAGLLALNFGRTDEDPEGVLLRGNTLYYIGPDDYVESEAVEGAAYERPTWMWRGADGQLRPLVEDFVVRALNEVVDKPAVFTEEQAALMLAKLKTQSEDAADYAYIANGKLFRTEDGRTLEAEDNAAAEPYSWALGHNVRGASQSLGSKGCTDCHANDAPFLMAKVEGQGPLSTGKAPVEVMHERNTMLTAVYPKTAIFFKSLIIITMTLLIIHILLDVYRQATRTTAN